MITGRPLTEAPFCVAPRRAEKNGFLLRAAVDQPGGHKQPARSRFDVPAMPRRPPQKHGVVGKALLAS
jgi:hypothetical protein